MRIPKILCALSAMTLLSGVAYAAPQEAPPMSQDRPLVDTTWDMTPIENALTSKQVEFLNLYMNYPDSAEMSKLSRHVKESLPLYIAFHERQLDPKSLIHFRVTQLLNAGMTFNDIALLQGIMAGLREGRELDPQQMALLKVLIADVKKNQRISLNPWFGPLFSYVGSNPKQFTPKEMNILRDALLVSVGITPKDLNILYDFADRRSNSPIFDEKEIGAANKLILLAYLQGVDLLNPEKISYLQFAINQNRAAFGPEKTEAFNRAVDASKVVDKFKYESFEANNPEKRVPQSREQIERPQSQYLDQQKQIQAVQSRQQQMSQEELDARNRYYQQQADMQQRAAQMSPQQIEAYQRQAQQQQATQEEQSARQRYYQQQAYQQQMQQQAEMQQRAAQMTPQQMQAYQQQMQQQQMQAYQQQMQQQQMQ
jgi:hypothetical protein